MPVEDIISTYTEAITLLKKIPVPKHGTPVVIVNTTFFPQPLRSRLERHFNKAYYVSPEMNRWEKACLNPSLDVDEISRAFNAGEVVVIDDFMTPECLEVAERIGHDSQIWHETKQGNYVGSMSHDGFAPAPFSKLAKELEMALPQVFGEHTLIMHWGFKHDSLRGPLGIKAHADTAAINLNFWVTKDSANMDPEGGGLTIFDKRVGKDGIGENFDAYNNNNVDSASLGFTDRDIKKKVAYRQNRAVLFHSSYFHETQHHKFKPGYTNRRINFTLLFGFMESIRCSACEKTQGDFCTSAVPSSHGKVSWREQDPPVRLPTDANFHDDL